MAGLDISGVQSSGTVILESRVPFSVQQKKKILSVVRFIFFVYGFTFDFGFRHFFFLTSETRIVPFGTLSCLILSRLDVGIL